MLANSQAPGARILEVGCGTGTGSEIIAQTVMSKQGSPILVMSDFSGEMMRLAKRRLEESDYSLIPGNKLEVDTETDFIDGGIKKDLDAMVAGHGDGFRKLVYGCRASGSALPFPDSWFTCYVSNLVLQLIDSPENQIREAYRVLKPGSIAAFTVWGRKDFSLLFTTQAEAARRKRAAAGEDAGEPFPAEPEGSTSNFSVGQNISKYL